MEGYNDIKCSSFIRRTKIKTKRKMKKKKIMSKYRVGNEKHSKPAIYVQINQTATPNIYIYIEREYSEGINLFRR